MEDRPLKDTERAFPFAAEYGHPGACGGMFLRDWFAGQALTDYAYRYQEQMSAEDIATQCYGLADAMLAARLK